MSPAPQIRHAQGCPPQPRLEPMPHPVIHDYFRCLDCGASTLEPVAAPVPMAGPMGVAGNTVTPPRTHGALVGHNDYDTSISMEPAGRRRPGS